MKDVFPSEFQNDSYLVAFVKEIYAPVRTQLFVQLSESSATALLYGLGMGINNALGDGVDK